MNAAAEAADKAFSEWKDASLMTRQQVMFKLQAIIRDNMVSSMSDIGHLMILPSLGTGGAGGEHHSGAGENPG